MIVDKHFLREVRKTVCYTASYEQKQGFCAVIGLVALYFFSRIPTEFWYRAAWSLYGVSILLLLSVLVIGQEVNGAKRWINLAGIQFQPSEIAKMAVVVYFSICRACLGMRRPA